MLKRFLAGLSATTLLLLLAATPAAAYIDSHVTVYNADGTPAGDTVCQFYVVFGPDATDGGESGSWELLGAGDVVVQGGTYTVTATDSDRVPDTGAWSLPDGTYRLRYDDETPIDASYREIQIVVNCPEATPTPTVAPTPTPTVAPTPTPTPTAAPVVINATAVTCRDGDTDSRIHVLGLIVGLHLLIDGQPATLDADDDVVVQPGLRHVSVTDANNVEIFAADILVPSCQAEVGTPTPTPTATVVPATGTPKITPPPTDTASGTSTGGTSVALILAAIGAIATAAIALAPRRRVARRP